MSENPKLLKLDPMDNCLIVRQKIMAGETLNFDKLNIKAKEDIETGFKIASCDIEAGEKIYKWGMGIGSATLKIYVGEVIHTHNMKSDYISTVLRDDQDGYFQTAKA